MGPWSDAPLAVSLSFAAVQMLPLGLSSYVTPDTRRPQWHPNCEGSDRQR